MRHLRRTVVALCVGALATALLVPSASGQTDGRILDPLPDPTLSKLTLTLEPFASIPPSQPRQPPTDARLQRTNRINYVGEIPDGSGRLYVPDLNGKLYLLLDGEPVQYLDVRANFERWFWDHAGLGVGFGFVEFHPDFAENGKFYTVHTEGFFLEERRAPDLPHWPQITRHGVVTEWTASDPAADTFSGTSREVLRLGYRSNIHGIQQIGFNPTSGPGDEDYGLLYIASGDGGSAHNTDLPQDLSRAEGTILRIDPLGDDSGNGQYGIPATNPFVADPGALSEIWAYGVRNPHRFSWDPATKLMYLGHIGEYHIESVYEVRKGDNLGWPLRAGRYVQNQSNRWLYPLPEDDADYGFTYPVLGYDHNRRVGQEGDLGVAIVGGFVYRGSIPELRGLYVFGDIVSGRIFFADARSRNSLRQENQTMAPVYEFQLRDGDGNAVTMTDLILREGSACIIAPAPIQDCRVDLRFGQDAAGELYVTSKASGTVWKITDAERAALDTTSTVVTDVRTAADWAPVTPSRWSFPGNEVIQTQAGTARPGPRRPFEYAIVQKGPEWGSFELDALVRVDVATPIGRDVLIFFGWQSDTEFYYVHLSEDTHDYVHNGIFKVDNADRLRIDDQWDGTTSAPAALSPGINWEKVKVVRDAASGRIEVYVDGAGEPLMTATDTTFTTGRVGFGSFDDRGRIRGLTVTGTPAPVTLPVADATPVVAALRPSLVNHWNFENPVAGDPGNEVDLGNSGTDLWLVNGGSEMRVQDPAYPSSTFSIQTRQVTPTGPASRDDWKAGVWAPPAGGGYPTLGAFNAVQGITVMGWFKQTGTNPSRNTNSTNPNAMFNAVGLAGVLSGNSTGHDVRALLEVIQVGTDLRLVALARRVDGAASNTFAANEDWQVLFPHDEWVHLAATFNFNDGTMALFRNGVPLDGFYTNTGNPWNLGPPPNFTTATNPTGIKIGGSYPQNTNEQNPCNCRMDGLMFLNTVATPAQVAAQYQALVDTPPALTRVAAGTPVPVNVDLGGDLGPAPFTISSNQVSCDSGQPLGATEAATERITYDAASGVYTFGWRTEGRWTGTCRALLVTTGDGAVYSTRYQFA